MSNAVANGDRVLGSGAVPEKHRTTGANAVNAVFPISILYSSLLVRENQSGQQLYSTPLTALVGVKSTPHARLGTLQISMKQQRAKKAPTPASWKPGQSGNPNGRPRTGLAFAEAVRERLDPHRVLDLVERMLDDEEVPLERRLASVLPYVHAGFVRPPSELALNVTGSSSTSESWDGVPIEKRREALAALRAAREQRTPIDAGPQPDSKATQVTDPKDELPKT